MSDIVERLRVDWIDNEFNEVSDDAIIEIESLRQQLAEANAEIEKLRLDFLSADSQAFDSWQQLAASQLREQQLRDLTRRLISAAPGHAGQCSGLKCREQYCYSCNDEESADAYLQGVWDLCHEADEALALPTDTSALEAMIAKAGEVMRERFMRAYWISPAEFCHQMINAMSGVTMEDLK